MVVLSGNTFSSGHSVLKRLILHLWILHGEENRQEACGKLFTMTATQLQPLYPRWADFHALLRRYDPAGKFRNGYLERFFFS